MHEWPVQLVQLVLRPVCPVCPVRLALLVRAGSPVATAAPLHVRMPTCAPSPSGRDHVILSLRLTRILPSPRPAGILPHTRRPSCSFASGGLLNIPSPCSFTSAIQSSPLIQIPTSPQPLNPSYTRSIPSPNARALLLGIIDHKM